MNPFTAIANHPDLVRRRDRVREQLFEAGWKPGMSDVTTEVDDKIRGMLLKLNAANAAITMNKLRR